MKSEFCNCMIVGNWIIMVYVGFGCFEIVAMIAVDKYMFRKNNSNFRNIKNLLFLFFIGYFVVFVGVIMYCLVFSDFDGYLM